MTKFYLPNDDLGRIMWLQRFVKRLAVYQSDLNIAAAEVAALQAEVDYLRAIYSYHNQLSSYCVSITTHKDAVMKGDKVSEPIPAPTLPPMPPGFRANVLGRVRKLVRAIKVHANYTTTIGKDLDVIGAAETESANAMKPKLKVKINAGYPLIIWKKGAASALKIYVDRNDGKGFKYLTTDMISPYADLHPLPPAGTAAIWKYRAVYLLNDEEVGEFSNTVEVTVSGKL